MRGIAGFIDLKRSQTEAELMELVDRMSGEIVHRGPDDSGCWVDPETGKVTPIQYVAVQDVGFALNPMMVEGQMQGGGIQGLGMGLHEQVVYDENGVKITSWPAIQ